MTRKTSFVSLFLVFAVLSGSAYAEENYATETYVDDQFAEVVGHVNKQDRTIRNEMKTNNDQLFANLVLLRDMLNTRDADRNWITLDTEAQLAIPAINELKAALDTKANADEVLTADSLTTLNEAITALQTGKADASTVTDIQTAIDNLGDTYATDDDVSAAIAGVQSAIDNIDLSAYAKIADLAPVATTGQYADLEGKPEIPSIEGLATTDALNNLQTTLQAAIDEKQAAGEYLVAADLTELSDAVAALETGKADASTVSSIQETISKLGDTYASKSELTSAEERLQAAISNIDLTAYAKTADVNAALLLKEDAANKLSSATAAEIEAMSSDQKAKLYPSVAVSQTIANAAVTKVNEVAGDLSTLQTQVETNTADIKTLNEAGYLTQEDAADTYLTQEVAGNTYLTEEKAGNTYLTQESAQNTYLTQEDAADTYLTQEVAGNTYLTEEKAGNTYLTQESAQNTYLTQESAQNTYLTQENAQNTYLTQENVNQFVDIPDGSITAAKLNASTIEEGAMAMLTVNPETGRAEWVSVRIVDDPAELGK